MTTQRIGLILATAAALATKLFVQKVAQLFRSEVIFVMVLVWNRSASFHIFFLLIEREHVLRKNILRIAFEVYSMKFCAYGS